MEHCGREGKQIVATEIWPLLWEVRQTANFLLNTEVQIRGAKTRERRVSVNYSASLGPGRQVEEQDDNLEILACCFAKL